MGAAAGSDGNVFRTDLFQQLWLFDWRVLVYLHPVRDAHFPVGRWELMCWIEVVVQLFCLRQFQMVSCLCGLPVVGIDVHPFRVRPFHVDRLFCVREFPLLCSLVGLLLVRVDVHAVRVL